MSFQNKKIQYEVVRIEHIRPNQAKVAWTPTVNAYAYQITIEGTSPNTAGFYRQGIVEENQFDALGLEPNASYRVEVKASLEDGELGTSSAPAFFMTASLPEALYTFQAFPNPASNFIQLNFAEETREKMSLIQIIDDQGRIRKQFPASDFTGQGLHIPIVDLPNGMYVIVIRHKDQRTFRKQLMIAR